MEDEEIQLAKDLSMFFLDKKAMPHIALHAMMLQMYTMACLTAENPKQALIGVSQQMLNLSQIAERINPEDLDIE